MHGGWYTGYFLNMKNIKKILIILPWGVHGIGGIERVMINLANGLCRLHIVEIIAFSTNDVMRPASLNNRVIFHSYTITRIRYSLGHIRGYLSKHHPHIILTNTSHITLIVWLARLLASNNASVVSINHGIDVKNMKSKLLAVLAVIVSTTTVAVSEGIKTTLAAMLPLGSSGIKVIYNGIDNAQINTLALVPVRKKDIVWNTQRPLVVSVGRLVAQKSHETIIAATALIVKERGIPINVVIIGDGELRKDLQTQAGNLGIHEYVFFLGWKDNPYQFINLANMFVLSSNFEGFPTVLIEALACGVSVVSTDCPSGPMEILDKGKYGKIVPVRRPREMADAIIETLKAPAANESLLNRASQLSKEEMVKKYVTLIKKI